MRNFTFLYSVLFLGIQQIALISSPDNAASKQDESLLANSKVHMSDKSVFLMLQRCLSAP